MIGLNLQANSTCFIDTNIWLYSFIESQDRRKTKIAKSIISESDIIISTQIVNEMSVNLLKKASFSEAQIRELIISLYKRYTVLGACPRIGISFKVEEFSKNKRRHMFDIPSIIF